LPTSFFLKDHVVDDLPTAAHTLLYQNRDFKKPMTDLEASPTTPRAGSGGVVK
jgi:hypothetical protein